MPSRYRIEGVAYLPEPGEEWIVPGHDVSLDLDMDPRKPIGRALLAGHGDGSITCVANLADAVMDGSLLMELERLPFLALTGGRIDGDAYSVLRVNVVAWNVNPLVPPYRLEACDA